MAVSRSSPCPTCAMLRARGRPPARAPRIWQSTREGPRLTSLHSTFPYSITMCKGDSPQASVKQGRNSPGDHQKSVVGANGEGSNPPFGFPFFRFRNGFFDFAISRRRKAPHLQQRLICQPSPCAFFSRDPKTVIFNVIFGRKSAQKPQNRGIRARPGVCRRQ